MSPRRSARLRSNIENGNSLIPSEISEDINETNRDNDDRESEIRALQSMDRDSALNFIRKNYSNPSSLICYSSITGLKKIFKSLSEDDIKSVLSKFESWSLMKSSKDNHIYNPFLSHNLRDVFQMDCIQLKELAQHNQGFNYLLCVIDVFSKWLWCRPMKSTTAEETVKTLKSIFEDIEVLPECIVCDLGSEFRNHLMFQMLKSLNIKIIFTQSSFKASGIERAQYTLERLIFSHITAHETLSYIEILQDLITRYNKSKHSFTGFTPLEVESSEEKQDIVLMKFGEKYRKLRKRHAKYSIGDEVRILLFKSPFHRGYNIQRSYERFKIHKILNHKVPLYILQDEKQRVIAGLFNEYELVKINIPRYRIIVKDTKFKKNKKWIRVHYKGFSSDFDEWRVDDGVNIVPLEDEGKE